MEKFVFRRCIDVKKLLNELFRTILQPESFELIVEMFEPEVFVIFVRRREQTDVTEENIEQTRTFVQVKWRRIRWSC